VGGTTRRNTAEFMEALVLDPADSSMTLVLDGEIDICLEPDLDRSLDAVRRSDVAEVIVDLERVTFMDGTGLRFLFSLQCLLDQRGGSLTLAEISPAVRRLFELTQTGPVFGVPPVRIEDAVGATAPEVVEVARA
jgi:anti-sigma B factor antagonist